MPETIAADGCQSRPIRASPLARIARPGRFGAGRGVPGVELSVRHPASIVTVIARKGKADGLAVALKELSGCAVYWAGFDQYYVVAEGRAEGALHEELKRSARRHGFRFRSKPRPHHHPRRRTEIA